MAITIQEINELRKKTQAGLMDCKKALTEANGDMEAAMEILRKKGQLLTHDKDQAVSVVLSIRSLIETNIVSVGEYDTLGDMVVRVIPHTTRNIFPVVSSEGKLLGIVEFDKLRKDMFDQSKYPNSVQRYMTTPPDMIYDGESASSVLEKFENTGAWNLPVVDESGHYLGFVSKSRILTAYREKLKEMTQE